MPAILFDLDETLIDRSLAVTRFAEGLWEASGQGESRSAFVEAVHAIDGHGYTPRETFFEEMWQRFGDGIGSPELLQTAFYEQVWRTPNLADGVVNTLTQLRDAGIPMGVVTNGSTEAQTAKIESSGLSHFFDAVVISEAFGMKKPAPEIFLACADTLGTAPTDCWFVGDHPVNDIWGSKQVGCLAAWIHLERPWSPEIERCHDVAAPSFRETMTQVLARLGL